jgi:hypothetical protein
MVEAPGVEGSLVVASARQDHESSSKSLLGERSMADARGQAPSHGVLQPPRAVEFSTEIDVVSLSRALAEAVLAGDHDRAGTIARAMQERGVGPALS